MSLNSFLELNEDNFIPQPSEFDEQIKEIEKSNNKINKLRKELEAEIKRNDKLINDLDINLLITDANRIGKYYLLQ